MISDSLGDCGGMPGRDTFIELLRQNDLMVRMRRRKHYRTTYSEHNYRKYPNLVKGVIPTRPNQITETMLEDIPRKTGGKMV
jgi:hypothetical protein